jgi:toxin YoeB
MRISFTPTAWKDYLYWQKIDKKKVNRINTLIKESTRTPMDGIGNPEALKHELQGFWSRRIDSEHRLVYRFSESELVIIACRYHY